MDHARIQKTILDRIDEIRAHGVVSISLFGSVVRGEATLESDIDVLVEFDGPVTFDRYMGLKLFLEDLLGAKVDLVTPRSLKPRIRPQIEAEAVRVA